MAEIFRTDGTIAGLAYCARAGRRPAVINVKLRDGNRTRHTSFTVEGRDFYEAYSLAVQEVATFHGCVNSRLHQRMLRSDGLFLFRYGLKAVAKTYFQLERSER